MSSDAEDLAERAAQQVRATLEAARRRSEEIVREAEAEAERIRSDAEAEARDRLDQVRRSLADVEAALHSGPQPPREEENPAPPRAEPERKPRPPDPEPEAQREQGPVGDVAARLVAMKLALDGTPRDQARTRLAAEYDLEDLDSLLDEVYAKAGN